MSHKRKRCATCGADLTNKQYHQIYDYQQGKMVRVCADTYSCKKPFVKGGNYNVNHIESIAN